MQAVRFSVSCHNLSISFSDTHQQHTADEKMLPVCIVAYLLLYMCRLYIPLWYMPIAARFTEYWGGVGPAPKSETPSVPFKYTHRCLASSRVCLFFSLSPSLSHAPAGISQLLTLLVRARKMRLRVVVWRKRERVGSKQGRREGKVG